MLFAVDATPDLIEAEVKDILSRWSDDPESGHGDADDLAHQVLAAIAINRLKGTDAQRAALAVLPLFDNNLTRWFA